MGVQWTGRTRGDSCSWVALSVGQDAGTWRGRESELQNKYCLHTDFIIIASTFGILYISHLHCVLV